MREATFPKPVNAVVATAADILRHQGRTELVELLESAHAYFDETGYDNWNGGTYTWALRLEVPVHIFASVELRLESIEKEIGSKLNYLDRQYPNDHLSEVTISPVTEGAKPQGQRMAPSDIEVRRVWQDKRFRLFISHVSKHKVTASRLKDALGLRGVDAFVAHEDIEPSLEWQHEIEVGLRSMHALLALLTPDFHESRWTDHEIGWALGRGVLVVPVRLGVDPYGLAGKFQGVPGTLEQPEALADAVVRTLLTNSLTCGDMRRALIEAYAEASSFDEAKTTCGLLAGVAEVTEDERNALWKTCAENPYVVGADTVDTIYARFGSPPATEPAGSHDDIPF